jgi:hypothetical protein
LIEIIEASNGHKIVRYDGRLTASRIDPVREAREWLSRHGVFVADVKSIFVLGLGSGYHVAHLQESTSAEIVVIEPDLQLIDAVSGWQHFDPHRVFIEPIQTSRGLRACEKIRLAVKESFLVLTHPPSEAFQPEYFKDVKAQLLGRDWGSLNWQWNLKGFAPLEAASRVQSSEAPLSIYDLEQTELVQNSEEREKLLIKALRELVK